MSEGCFGPNSQEWTSLVPQLVKNPPAMRETRVGKIPWRRERLPTPVFWPGEFHGPSMGLQRVGHDWGTFTFTLLHFFLDYTNQVTGKVPGAVLRACMPELGEGLHTVLRVRSGRAGSSGRLSHSATDASAHRCCALSPLAPKAYHLELLLPLATSLLAECPSVLNNFYILCNNIPHMIQSHFIKPR